MIFLSCSIRKEIIYVLEYSLYVSLALINLIMLTIVQLIKAGSGKLF